VLRKVWEGIVMEYWRQQGKSLKNYKFDLKHIVWTWWTRDRSDDDRLLRTWTPVFTPVEHKATRPVLEAVTHDPRMHKYVGGMKEAEKSVKLAERGMRHSTCTLVAGTVHCESQLVIHRPLTQPCTGQLLL